MHSKHGFFEKQRAEQGGLIHLGTEEQESRAEHARSASNAHNSTNSRTWPNI